MFFFRGASLPMVIDTMQKDLSKYNSWCIFNKLTLNVDKTKAIIFDCKNRSYDNVGKLQINKKYLEYVENFKYLCVTLDRRLNFRIHYNDVINRLNKKIHLFCKLRKTVNTMTALTMNKSHILSFIEYGISLWNACRRKLSAKSKAYKINA